MDRKCIKRRFGVSGHGAEEDGILNTLYMKTKIWWILKDLLRKPCLLKASYNRNYQEYQKKKIFSRKIYSKKRIL